jgi:hypothetical protein
MLLIRSLGRRSRWGLAALALTTILLALPLKPAEARVWVGVGIGLPVWGGYYYPYAAAPYPYYYGNPGGYYYYPPAAQPVPAPSAAPQQGGVSTTNCRDYSSTETIDGRPQTVTGSACQQPDGSWRIVR